MEEYPEELRTPPVTLISIVGCTDIHISISSYLHSEKPPINTLALPDISKISLFSKKKGSESNTSSSPPSTGGILKRDWLLKHRTKIPSVLAVLFPSDHVAGDPAQWLQVCSDLDSIKTVIRERNIKLVVVVVRSNPLDDINEDRMIAFRKRAEVDFKYLVTFDTSDLKQSLSRLGSTFAELAITYYRDEGRRVKMRVDKKSVDSAELCIRYCFKVAVYAEFRRDWVEALRFYEDAYHALREIVGVSTRLPPVQRLVEIKIIAEQLHFKISTLLLHSGKVLEAVSWFRTHNASYRKLIGVPETIFLHWEWLSRQFLVFGELLETSSKTIQGISSASFGAALKSLSEWEFHPAYYYQFAAQYSKEKRSALESVLSISKDASEVNSTSESVVPSAYVGQFARLIEQGDAFSMLPLDDEEYIQFAISEGKRFRDSYEIIALLKKACESFSSLKAKRMDAFCGFQMAGEYFAEGDFSEAKKIFDDVATLYRQEGWVSLLWEVLGYLQDCSRKRGIVKDFVEYSLEMAALPVSSDILIQNDCGPAGPANLLQRECIHKKVFELVSGTSGLVSNEYNDFIVSGDKPLHLEIDLVSPLRLVLVAAVAFHELTVKPSAPTSITISLLSQLPLIIEIDHLEIQFNQSDCNFLILNDQKPELAETNDIQGRRVEKAPSLSLASNRWLRLTYNVQSDQVGKLECLSVTAKMGPHFTICCRAESPASMDNLPLWKFEDCVEKFPAKDPILAFSGQKSCQVEEPDPQVELHLGASCPALVGEIFMVPVTVVSKEHSMYSGELKINLVDVRGGGLFSPRELVPSPMDSPHVELVGISGPKVDESQLDSDKIRKIQQSFGLISVPFLTNGGSWSCKLEIKWHRPKPIMLFVSLGYSTSADELNEQKIHVHKSLQIEGKTAVTLSHCYMLPFRRDPLLPSTIKQVSHVDGSASLPLKENNILIVKAKNCTEVPLQIQSVSIEVDTGALDRPFSIQHAGDDLSNPALLVPGEEFRKVFAIIPWNNISKARIGTICLRWRRDLGNGEHSNSSITVPWVVTREELRDINVELPPLIVSMECPPYAILGETFTYNVKIQNQTEFLQDVKLSMADAQSFVLSGPHNDTLYVLPKSQHILSYKLVPLASGMQLLPRFTVTSVRYSAALQPTLAASSVFVYPSKPHFELSRESNNRVEPVATL